MLEVPIPEGVDRGEGELQGKIMALVPQGKLEVEAIQGTGLRVGLGKGKKIVLLGREDRR